MKANLTVLLDDDFWTVHKILIQYVAKLINLNSKLQMSENYVKR